MAVGSPAQENRHRDPCNAQPHAGELAASFPAQEKRLPVLLHMRTGNLHTTCHTFGNWSGSRPGSWTTVLIG